MPGSINVTKTATTVVCTNDWHLTARPPMSRTDDYITELLGLLDQIGKVADHVKADAIAVAGDFFHLKGQVPYWLLWHIWDWCRQRTVVGIPGNHDLTHNRLASLPDTVLGFLIRAGVVIDVSTGAFYTGGAGFEDVAIYGVPFPDAFELAAWQAKAREVPLSSPRSLVMGHCFATPEGGDHFGEPVLRYRDLAALPFDAFHFGHDHSDRGVQIVEGKPFINLGALARGTRSKEDITRDVKCAIATFAVGQPVGVLQVKLDAKPAHELFDLQQHAARAAEETQVQAFVEQLAQDLASSMIVAPQTGLTARVKQLGLPDVVYQRAMQYLAAAEVV
jgi:hypothetical protein